LFYSVSHAKAGQRAVSFNPGDLPVGVAGGRARVEFEGNHVHSDLFDLVDEYRRSTPGFVEAVRSSQSNAAEFGRRRAESFLRVFHDDSKSRLVRHAAGVLAVSASWSLSDRDKWLIREFVGPDCPMWALHPVTDGAGIRTSLGTDEEAEAFVSAKANRSPDKRVRARALIYFLHKAQAQGDHEKASRILKELAARYFDLRDIREEVEPTAPHRKLVRGVNLPPLEFSSIDGRALKNNAVGQYTLLEFSVVGCTPCLELIPVLARLRSRHSERQLRIVTLTYGVDPTTLRALLARQPHQPWLHVAIPESEHHHLHDLEVFAFPTLYLVGPDGRILASDVDLQKGNLERVVSSIVDGARLVDP
jgi:hypothetical protein